MRLFIALRLISEHHAKSGLEARGPGGQKRGQLIDSNITRLYPALRNIAQHLAFTGKLPDTREGNVLQMKNGKCIVERTTSFRIFWCEVESDLPQEYWRSQREVEAVIVKREFESFVAAIRHRGGSPYIQACEEYADEIEVYQHPDIGYVPPRGPSTRAA